MASCGKFIVGGADGAIVLQAEAGAGRFFVLPLRPGLVEKDGKPSIHLTFIEKSGVIIQCFISLTVTLPMDDALEKKIKAHISKSCPDIKTESVSLIRADLRSCSAKVVFAAKSDHPVRLQGTYEGVGEPRIAMQANLSGEDAKNFAALWEGGAENSEVVYDVTLALSDVTRNTMKLHAASSHVQAFAGEETQWSGSAETLKGILTQERPDQIDLHLSSPLRLGQKEREAAASIAALPEKGNRR